MGDYLFDLTEFDGSCDGQDQVFLLNVARDLGEQAEEIARLHAYQHRVDFFQQLGATLLKVDFVFLQK